MTDADLISSFVRHVLVPWVVASVVAVAVVAFGLALFT